MNTFKHETSGDVIHVDGPVADYYAAREDWTEVETKVAVAEGSSGWDDFTVPQLKEYADANGVDLTGATTKAAIITKIEEN